MGMAARSSSPWTPRTPAVTAVVLMSNPRKRASFAMGYLLSQDFHFTVLARFQL
jgi:hypothetical protein